MMNSRSLYLVVVLAICVEYCSGLTFYLTEGKERCFHDEYAPNTVIIGNHQLIDKLPQKYAKDGVALRVIDPENNVLLTKHTNNEEGKFTFTTKKGT
jgi:hypothetical protein